MTGRLKVKTPSDEELIAKNVDVQSRPIREQPADSVGAVTTWSATGLG